MTFYRTERDLDLQRSWRRIANDKDSKVEAVLDYIVERKRLDDLSKSIIDGRYNEQKVSKRKETNFFNASIGTNLVSIETMWHQQSDLFGRKFEEYK